MGPSHIVKANRTKKKCNSMNRFSFRRFYGHSTLCSGTKTLNVASSKTYRKCFILGIVTAYELREVLDNCCFMTFLKYCRGSGSSFDTFRFTPDCNTFAIVNLLVNIDSFLYSLCSMIASSLRNEWFELLKKITLQPVSLSNLLFSHKMEGC